MTTRIRIEHADAGRQTPILVQMQEVDASGQWANVGPAVPLMQATAMFEGHVHANRRFIVSGMYGSNA